MSEPVKEHPEEPIRPSQPEPGLRIRRVHTQPGVHPFEQIEWVKRSATITNERGEVIFEQHDAEVPCFWSQLATDIAVSKYFRKSGVPGEGHESSVKQLIYRVAHTIREQGERENYFASKEDTDAFEAELSYLLVTQRGAFNSPVWFNCGLFHEYGIVASGGNWYWDPEAQRIVQLENNYEHPQCSACFIQGVEDSLDSMTELQRSEVTVFKYGSGSGTNFSKIRGLGEPLSGGGESSGVLSFLEGFDRWAGSIKSGGTTRRAAKMVCLDMDHPEIADFINWKVREEEKVAALVAAGYPADFNGEAYRTVSGQNSNNSVRIPDEFMQAYQQDEPWHTRFRTTGEIADSYQARDLMRQIAEAAWKCADPGVQFDTTINDWHTCAATDRIHASNPCVTGDTRVATSEGWQRIADLVGRTARIIGADGQSHFVEQIFPTGHKSVFRLRTRSGYEVRITGDHKVLTVEHGDVPVNELRVGNHIRLEGAGFGRRVLSERLALAIGVALGDGCLTRTEHPNSMQEIIILVMAPEERGVLAKIACEVHGQKQALRAVGAIGNPQEVHVSSRIVGTSRLSFSSRPVVALFKEFSVLDEGSDRKRFTPAVFELDRASMAALLRGLFTADGTVANYGDKSQYISLDSTSEELLRQVQTMLLSFSIKSKLYRDRRGTRTGEFMPDGKGGTRIYQIKQMYSLRISRSSRVFFEREIGFEPESPKAEALAQMNSEFATYTDQMTDPVVSIEPLGEEAVYDLTEQVTHHFIANGLVVHNCSEYMFLDNSACNLASINLTKYLDSDGHFDIEGFRHACHIFFIAQEILVDFSSYPVERIALNSHLYRPLGLGYANLGALLMRNRIPYDSPRAAAVAAAITAILCGHAYRTSAEMAAIKGPFEGFPKNCEPMMRVMSKHRAATYQIDPDHCSPYLLKAAQQEWDEVIRLGELYGYRNAQASVLAPTGTIGLLLDCDTTGVEPDFALVKFKKLAGGGSFKIVNQSVPVALEHLGYTPKQIEQIVSYAQGTLTLEQAPHIHRQSLRLKGFTDEDITRIEEALPGAFELRFAFNVKTLGAELMERLGIPEGEYSAPQFDFLSTIGFTTEQIEEASRVICGTLTLEGAPHLRPEDLPIFDCANRCGTIGERFIKPMGHIRMMSAVQPFLSGSISKTVNMPNEATVEDIEGLYVQSWQLGIKAVAIYRDGSKLSQPLSARTDAKEETQAEEPRPLRRRLPDERRSITHKFSVAGHEGYMTVGMYDDGMPGEVFLRMAKEGSVISGLMDTIATMTSVALQYGVPPEALVRKFSHMRFEPSGFTNNPQIPIAKSIVDYIFRWIGLKFLGQGDPLAKEDSSLLWDNQNGIARPKLGNPAGMRATLQGDKLTAQERLVHLTQSDAPTCFECGAIMVRNGSCYRCLNCGSTSGCS